MVGKEQGFVLLTSYRYQYSVIKQVYEIKINAQSS